MRVRLSILALALSGTTGVWAQEATPRRTPLPPIPEIEADWRSLFGELEEEDEDVEALTADAAPLRYQLSRASLSQLPFAAEFRDLSLLVAGEGDVVPSLAELNRRVRVDRDVLMQLLRAEGYYDPLVDVRVTIPEGEPNRRSVVFEVDTGPLYRFGEVDAQGLDIAEGDPVQAEEVLAAVTELNLRLPREGYPFAEVAEPEIVIDHETRLASMDLAVDPGPRGRFGDIVVSGDDPPFGARHVARLTRFKRGDVYNAEEIDDLRRALIATGLVGSADITPVRGDTLPEGETEVELNVALSPSPPRTLAAQIAYDTEDGFRIEGSWQHRNFVRPEGALTGSLVVGTQERLAAIDFVRSNYKARDVALGGRIAAFQQDRDAFYSRGFALSGFYERETNLIWQKRWTYRLGPELVLAQERDRSAIVGVPAALRTYYIAAFPAQLSFDASNDLLNPTEGVRLLGRLSPEVSFEGGSFFYSRAEVAASTYLPLTEDDSTVIALRGLVGSILGSNRRNIAPSRRFYAGGGASVRGYGFQNVGPSDADRDPLGGRSKVEASIEGRYRFGDLGAVAFVDAGQVYTGAAPTFDSLRYGIGIGARYFTRFGPVRADIATPINRRPGEARVAVYVSIGQAF
ncbi:autotransporter assembly complex protein TamA [Pacificimonas sp. ICDLI1SI03]